MGFQEKNLHKRNFLITFSKVFVPKKYQHLYSQIYTKFSQMKDRINIFHKKATPQTAFYRMNAAMQPFYGFFFYSFFVFYFYGKSAGLLMH